MKKLGKRLIAGVMVFALAFTALPEGSITAEAKGTTQVSIKKPSGNTVKLLVGKSYQLKTNMSYKKLKFSSSNKKVATVTSKGKIKAVKKGTAKITVASKTNKKNKASIKVKVSIPVKNITFKSPDTKTLVLKKNKTYKLKVNVSPSNAANKKVSYSSSKKKIVTVDKNGKITAKKNGTTTIIVTAKDGSKKKATLKVIVGTPATSVKLDNNSLTGQEGDTLSLKATVSPSKASVKSVTWTSSNEDCAMVDSTGKVTLKKAGTVVIKATAADGSKKSASCTIEVAAKSVDPSTEDKTETTETPSTQDKTETTETPSTQDKAETTETPSTEDKTETTETPSTEDKTEEEPKPEEVIPSYEGYHLVWNDEFNGTKLNSNDWNVELHEPGWVNEEWQSYVDSEENIYLEDGKLVIKPIKTGEGDDATYTSGRINTQNKQNFTYGKFEARLKVPEGNGFLPAFWLMAADESLYGQWPRCGEIDIMEVHGSAADTLYGTIHYGNPHRESQGKYTLTDGNFANEYHTFTCDWEPGKITWYVDGVKFHEEDSWFTKMEGGNELTYPAPFDQPFYIILNLAVGNNWAGYPDETTDFENAEYAIDYVRVYQKEIYDENVTKPEVVLRDPATEDGNYLYNGDFAVEEDLVAAEDWQFLAASDIGGEGSAAIAYDETMEGNAITIQTTTSGTDYHGVQLVQANVPFKKGNVYKLSFDAYASEERVMRTAVKAPDVNWTEYLPTEVVELTTEKQNFEYEFTMTYDNDANGRVEFNLGNVDSTADVIISNVVLECIGTDESVLVEPDKTILADGNHVYNGSFQEGDKRLGYWTISNEVGADVSVTGLDDGRRLKVVIPETAGEDGKVRISQSDLAIVANEEYAISFDAAADAEEQIIVEVAGETYETTVGTTNENYSYKLETGSELTNKDITITFDGPGIYYLDDVRIDEDAIIKNGSFAISSTQSRVGVAWEGFAGDGGVADYWIDNFNGNDNAATFEISNTGDADWKVQLKQTNVRLEKDQWYKLSFIAKSTMDRKIQYSIQRDGAVHKTADGEEDWTAYGQGVVDLTNEYATFEYEFQMTQDTDAGSIFNIAMGQIEGVRIAQAHTVYIDDIVLEKIDAPADDVVDVPLNTELIQNSDFEDGEDNWLPNINVANAATFSVTDGKAIFDVANLGTANWAVQLKQSGITIERGATYALEMNVTSSVSRRIEYSLMDAGSSIWYGGGTYDLTADQPATVTANMSVEDTQATNEDAYFILSLGKILETDEPGIITIESISLKKIVNGTTSGEEAGGDDENDDDTAEPQPEGTELITDGDFTLASNEWITAITTSYADGTPAAGTATIAAGIASYEITNLGSVNWLVQLKQKVAAEENATYQIKATITSDVDRTIYVMLQNGTTYREVGEGIQLKAGEPCEVDFERTINYTIEDSEEVFFVISMGNNGAETLEEGATNTITIDDVSVLKK